MWLGTGQIAREYCVAHKTVWGWMWRGCTTVSGVVKLRATRIGCRWKTQRPWLEEFFSRCSGAGAAESQAQAQPRETLSRARQAQEDARRRLAR